MEGEIITDDKYPEIVKRLNVNIYNYYNHEKFYTLTKDKEINAYCNVKLYTNTTPFEYPFGYVEGYFNCSNSNSITSLIGSPEKVGRDFIFCNCYKLTSLIGFPKYIKGHVEFLYNEFSNDPSDKRRHNLYINMWLELLESVSEDDKWKYINNYKDKVDCDYSRPIIPKEVINKYKIDFLLK